MTDLVPREPLLPVLCSRCHTNPVRNIGLLSRRELCPACIVIEGAIASVHTKYFTAIGVVIAIIGVAITAYVAFRRENNQAQPQPPLPPVSTSSNGPAPPQPPKPAPEVPVVPNTTSTSSESKSDNTSDTQLDDDAGPAITSPADTSIGAETSERSVITTSTSAQQPPASDESPDAPIESSDDRPPVVFDEKTVTATALGRHAQPGHTLTLPRAPHADRAYLSERCVVLLVAIAPTGEATVDVQDSGGVQEFFVKQIVYDASRPWIPASSLSGLPIEDKRHVRYCWP